MKLVIVCGSRNPEGQTARAANAITQGARQAGADVEIVYLPQQRIERCRQCDNDGWGLCRQGQACVIDDDLAAIRDKLIEADYFVVATPVYFSDLSESLRAFLDRIRRIGVHAGEANPLNNKPALGLCVAGGGGGGAPRCGENLDWILRTCGCDVIDMVPARRQNLDAKCGELEQLGAWLAAEKRTS